MKKLLFLSLLGLSSLSWSDSTTPRLGLTIPTIGSQNWGQKINNNFQILDSTFTGPIFSGPSQLAVSTNSVIVTSPTANINFSTNFVGTVGSFLTANIDLAQNLTFATATINRVYFPYTGTEIFLNEGSIVQPFLQVGSNGHPSIYFGYLSGNTTNSVLASDNVSFGSEALQYVSSNSFSCVAIGNYSLNSNVNGKNDVGIGYQSLPNVLSDGNIGIGSYAGGVSLTTGTNNIFIGNSAVTTSPGINNSIAIGAGSTVTLSNTCQIGGDVGSSNAINLTVSTATTSNIAWINRGTKMMIGSEPFLQVGLGANPSMFMGYDSGADTTSLLGNGNTAFGSASAFHMNSSAHSNSAFGEEALASDTVGFENNAFGYRCLFHLVSGLSNAAYGTSALQAATTTSNSSVFGDGAAQNTNSNLLSIFGFGALGDNTSGSDGASAFGTLSQTSLLSGVNSSFGNLSMASSLSADGNSAFGQNSAKHTNGANSEWFGDASGFNHLLGNHNSIMGSTALHEGTTIYDTVGIGYAALYYDQVSSNTCVGSECMSQVTYGTENTGLGFKVGRGNNPLTVGSSNTLLGYLATVSTGIINNSIAIGANAVVSSSNTCQIGGTANSSNAMTLNVASITAVGVNFSSVTLDDISSRQLYVSSTVFIGLSIDSITALGLPPQASEKLTVSGPGGAAGASNIDILSMNTSTWGARVVAYGGGSPGNHAVGIVGATGNTSPTFGWGGGINFNQSAFVELQTINPGMFHVTGNTTSYFYNSSNDSAWYFVRKNGIYNMGLEDQKLRLLPYPGVIDENGSLYIYASSSTTNQNLNITNAPLISTVTYTLPDVRADADFVMTQGSQTINGHKTFGSSTTLNSYLDVAAISNPTSPPTGTIRFHALTTQGFTRFEQDNEAPTNVTLGRDSVFIAKNTTAGNILPGQPVYVTGATGNVPNVGLAKADSTTTLPAIGVALDTITANNFGQIMHSGVIQNINTSAYAVGSSLWVSSATAGALVATRPISPAYAERIASVLVSGVGNGSLLIVTAPFIGGLESGTNTTFNAPLGISASTLTVTNTASVTNNLSAGTLTVTSSGTFGSSVTVNGQLIGKGTITNDNASAGYIGEYIEQTFTTAQNCGSNATFFDAATITISSGDWDVSAMLVFIENGATYTTDTYFNIAITTTSGNSSVGINYGVNAVQYANSAVETSVLYRTDVIPSYRMSVAVNTPIYLKAYTENYTVGTPQYKCRLSARRVR